MKVAHRADEPVTRLPKPGAVRIPGLSFRQSRMGGGRDNFLFPNPGARHQICPRLPKP